MGGVRAFISMAYTKRNKENKKENIPEAGTTI
jgi:hypothetical protein